MNRIVRTLSLVVWVVSFSLSLAVAQDESQDESRADKPDSATVYFESFDTTDEEGIFVGWNSMIGEIQLASDSESHEGSGCGLLDTRSIDGEQDFAGANYKLDPAELRNKRIRFSAMVKTADIDKQERVMLAIRAISLGNDGSRHTAAWDNMWERPIRDTTWRKYELVIDIGDDIQTIECGIVVVGKGAAWIDNAQVEVVDADVATTGQTRRRPVSSPFYTPWLWLAALVMLAFSLAFIEESIVQRFCLRFSIVYWLLYLVPHAVGMQQAIQSLVLMKIAPESWMSFHGRVRRGFDAFFEPMAQWSASHILGIEGAVGYVQTGSGDTIYSYVNLFNGFLLAVVVAAAWCLIPRLGRDHPALRDSYRSFLRYSLAIVLLGYGLAKAGFIATQFAQGGGPAESQLARTYGESSPMGLLWTFMAASPAYTFYSGLMEVVPAVLLLFRRTMVLGAAIAFAVMLNVFMLNACYEVPVKHFSFHLAAAAMIITLPEMSRLMSFFLLNRDVNKSSFMRPPYAQSGLSRRIHMACKVAFVSLSFAVPIVHHVATEVSHDHVRSEESKHVLMRKQFSWINETPDNR